MGAMVGASLTLSGVAMQSFTKNPLASPYVLGISSGATFGATLAIVTGVLSFLGCYAVEGGAFAGINGGDSDRLLYGEKRKRSGTHQAGAGRNRSGGDVYRIFEFYRLQGSG